MGAPSKSTEIPLIFLCAHPLPGFCGLCFSKICTCISLDDCLQALKAALPRRQRTGSVLVFMSPQGRFMLVTDENGNVKAQLLCFRLEETLKHNLGPGYSCRISRRLGLCLLLLPAWLLSYSSTTSLAPWPVTVGNISLIIHLHTNTYLLMGLRETQPETGISPILAVEASDFYLKTTDIQ